MSIKLFTLLFVVALLQGCGESEYNLMQSKEPLKSSKKMTLSEIEYKVQPFDRLAITIYQYPELTPMAMSEKGVLVDGEGYISLPLIHKVKVAGYTQSKAARVLESRYSTFLTDPALIIEVMNKRVYVLGEVKTPGIVNLENETMSIMQVIAAAGGMTDSAQRDRVSIVTHDGHKNMHLREIDMTSFAALQSTNIIVRSNDIVYVQPNKWKPFRVASDDLTSPFTTVAKVASPFVTLKYLSN